MGWGSKLGRVGAGIMSGGLSEIANQAMGGRIFGGGPPNPADAAREYLNKIPGELHGAYDPYIAQGKSAYENINPIYQDMTKDPAAYLENIMKGYQASPSYNYKLDQMTKAAGNTAAAGGMRGTLGDIQNEANLSGMLASEDMQNWLQNVLGVQGQGLMGQQHFYDTGYNAASSLGGDLANVLGTQGQLAFQGQANRNQQKSDLMSSLMGLGGAGFGAMFGGPGGAMAGGQAGKMIGGGFGGGSKFV